MSSIELLKMEAKRYKSLYEDEKGQFEEYQRYSKEVETELEAELKQNTKRIRDLEARNSRVTGDLDSLRVDNFLW
jgi:ribosomal protein S13